MKDLALQLPAAMTTTGPVPTIPPGPPQFHFNSSDTINLSYIVSQAMEIVFWVALFLVFIWALIGVFQYILAGGNKEGLAKARRRITWAFFGFIFLLASFVLSDYIKGILPTQTVTIQNISSPNPLPVYDPNMNGSGGVGDKPYGPAPVPGNAGAPNPDCSTTPLQNGCTCSNATDCKTNYCAVDDTSGKNICQDPPNGLTPGVNLSKKGPGSICSGDDSECESGNCAPDDSRPGHYRCE